MAATFSNQEIHCPSCGWSEVLGITRAVYWLRQAKLMGAKGDSTEDEIRELLPVAAERLACPECAELPLVIRQQVEDEADWPQAVRCEACGQPIPRERLEIMPDTKTCVACQQSDEAGAGPAEADYCPKCGTPLQMKARGGSGLAGYVMHCGQCGYRSR